MKCFSRSTLGVVIGVLNVVAYFAATIFLIITAVGTKEVFEKHQNSTSKTDETYFNVIFTFLILICLAMMAISGLLVMGIVKKNHKMMIPWLILTAISFVVNTLRFAYQLIFSMTHDVAAGEIVALFFSGLLGLALSALILWLIYTLYKDIKMQIIVKPTAAHGY